MSSPNIIKGKTNNKIANDNLKSDPDSVSLNDIIKEILILKNLMKDITEDSVVIFREPFAIINN